MTREEKSDLVERMLGLRHKLKVHDSMKSPETHEQLSHSLMSRWELEDEIKAIEILLDRAREQNVQEKMDQVTKEYLSGAPRPEKKVK